MLQRQSDLRFWRLKAILQSLKKTLLSHPLPQKIIHIWLSVQGREGGGSLEKQNKNINGTKLSCHLAVTISASKWPPSPDSHGTQLKSMPLPSQWYRQQQPHRARLPASHQPPASLAGGWRRRRGARCSDYHHGSMEAAASASPRLTFQQWCGCDCRVTDVVVRGTRCPHGWPLTHGASGRGNRGRWGSILLKHILLCLHISLQGNCSSKTALKICTSGLKRQWSM